MATICDCVPVSGHVGRIPRTYSLRPLTHVDRASRRKALRCASTNETRGPQGAFATETMGEARRDLFNRIAGDYDTLNDVLSLGMHRAWKKCAVGWCAPPPGGKVLDICTGSGDLAFLLALSVGSRGEVVALDFAAEILALAKQRYEDLPRCDRFGTPITFVEGDALDLPFQDSSFDAATMGYGLRNVSSIPVALSEIHRVLKPGAKASILDFNNPRDSPLVDMAQKFMLERVVVPAASQLGLAAEYEYLRPSIEAFPIGREQESLARQAGFSSATHYELMGGLMGCLVVAK